MIKFIVLIFLIFINSVTCETTDTTIVDDDTSTTTTIATTLITKPITFKPINSTDIFDNGTNESLLELIGSNNYENANRSMHFLAENTNKTIPNLVDHNKFVIKPSNSTEDTFISLQKKNTASAINAPLTLIIVIIGVVFVIIIIIISSLFVMRRRFSKWRLDTNGGGGSVLTREDGKNCDNLSSTNDALISKQDVNQVNDNGTVGGHENAAAAVSVSASQSSDSIKIENEINKAISDINAATGSMETVETTKLLENEPSQKEEKQIEVYIPQQSQVIETEQVIEKESEIRKSTVKLNDDIEKQPLNQE